MAKSRSCQMARLWLGSAIWITLPPTNTAQILRHFWLPSCSSHGLPLFLKACLSLSHMNCEGMPAVGFYRWEGHGLSLKKIYLCQYLGKGRVKLLFSVFSPQHIRESLVWKLWVGSMCQLFTTFFMPERHDPRYCSLDGGCRLVTLSFLQCTNII